MEENNTEEGSGEAKRRVQFEAWKKSGLSVRAFCKREGIGLNGFRYWKQKLEAGGKARSMVKVPLRISHLLPSIEVVVSGRFTVRVPSGFRAEELARLIRVLDELS